MGSNVIHKLYSSPKDVPRVRLVAPKNLCIYTDENIAESLNFLNSIPVTVFNEFKYLTLDFSQTTKITAAATLMMFGHVTRCQACTSREIFQFHDQIIDLVLPKDKACRQIFVGSKLWDAIKPGGIRKMDGSWSDLEQPFKTGKHPETQSLYSLDWIRSKIGHLPKKLHGAVQEAFLNIKHHAYAKKDLAAFMDDRWWQYAHIIEEEEGQPRRLVFLIYDMGTGIPSKSKTLLGSDSTSIKNAMEKGFSSTGIKGRGQGSEDLKKPTLISQNDDYLIIRSNRGHVSYVNGNITVCKNHRHSISGTLIEWSLVIEDKQDE